MDWGPSENMGWVRGIIWTVIIWMVFGVLWMALMSLVGASPG